MRPKIYYSKNLKNRKNFYFNFSLILKFFLENNFSDLTKSFFLD